MSTTAGVLDSAARAAEVAKAKGQHGEAAIALAITGLAWAIEDLARTTGKAQVAHAVATKEIADAIREQI